MTEHNILEPLRDDIRHALSEGRDELLARDAFSETDTREVLIAPFLEYMGHLPSHRRSEYQNDGNRPDEVIYDRTVSSVPTGSYGQIILEAKPLNTNFDEGAERDEIPDSQIQRYLHNHAASGPGTYGVLTDGIKYRIYRKVGSQHSDIRYLGDYDTLSPSLLETDDPIQTLFQMLRRDALSESDVPGREPTSLRPARSLLQAIVSGRSPTDILGLLGSVDN